MIVGTTEPRVQRPVQDWSAAVATRGSMHQDEPLAPGRHAGVAVNRGARRTGCKET